jgi:hypothetical protein
LQNQRIIFHSTYCNVQTDTTVKTDDFETPPSKTPREVDTFCQNFKPNDYFFMKMSTPLEQFARQIR